MMNLLKIIQNLYSNRAEQKGFTLIELLAVLAIIGILFSIVLASLNDARVKSQYTRAQQEMRQLGRAVIFAQGESESTLGSVTGSNCSACQCAADTNLHNISESNSCYTRWRDSLEAIIQAGEGISTGLEDAVRDPWGSPYLLDENEGEQPANFCRADHIRTAGEDGIRSTSDDYVLTLPFGTPRCN